MTPEEKKIPSFSTGQVKFSQISNRELQDILKKSVKVWHFEWNSDKTGVVPVAGECDPMNPAHIPQHAVIGEKTVRPRRRTND